MKLLKLNLKTIVLVALFGFYLVILLSNLFIREGMETKSTPSATTKPLAESEDENEVKESTEPVKPTPTHKPTHSTTKPKK